MTSKVIWIINQYASTPETGFAGRHYYLSKELAQKGYEVFLISASYTHNLHVERKFSEEIHIDKMDGDVTHVWVDVPKYSSPHGLGRIRNWFLFAYKLAKLPRILKLKPDFIYYSSLSLIGYIGAFYLKKKFKVPLIFEVRDIWPKTLIEMSKVSKFHPFVIFLSIIERFAYKSADYYISNLPNAIDHMSQYGVSKKRFSYIPNGISLEEMKYSESLNPKLEEFLSKHKSKFIIGYIGTIGFANALDVLVDVAEEFQSNESILFIVIGSGGEKNKLLEAVNNRSIQNIFFYDAIPKKQVQNAIKYFNVCYLGWKDKSLYKYGIGANKLPEYLYSGKPILHSYSGKGDRVELFSAGVTVPAENIGAIVKGITNLKAKSQKELNIMGRNGYKAAIQNYDYSLLADKLIEIFISLELDNN